MYPRYEYAHFDINNYERSPTLEPPPNYPTTSFEPTGQSLPEIESIGSKQKCRVCNLESHGMHFGVQSCRPCAAFFRRIVVLDLKYTCVSNTQKCNVEGRGRNVCRDCRYKKCLAVGMTTDNVQYNRDSHNNKNSAGSSGRPKNNKRNVMSDEEEAAGSSTVKLGGPIRLDESFLGYSDGSSTTRGNSQLDEGSEERDSEEMDKIISDLKYLFVEVGILYIPPKMITQCSINQLQRLTHALVLYRQNQQSANQIKFRDTINAFTDGKAYLQRRSEKFSKWVKNVDFFDKLSEQQKIDTVKLSFTIFDRLERAQMSVKTFGESCITEKKITLSSYCAVDWRTVTINPETAINTELANNYIITEFHSHINSIINDVCQPLYELQLSDTETAFLLTHVLVYYGSEKVSHELVEKFDDLREIVTSDLHHYYTKQIGVEVYANRLLKIMSVVNAMKKIHADRVRKSELIRIFNIYKVSEKRTDFNCS
ncbi:CRE-NHR-216 protein [Caenorhabditis remanei]|uniref:CRE-NHR-216 protein n=1 Tax=Caenorhabditis remanei TaxID=31234 RepID=E3LU79_CAERE|nr:CRE-NHR-216 protein [Caenorhabditis remanei]